MLKQLNFKVFAILLLITALSIYAQGGNLMPYPVEDFADDPAYEILRVIDGDTVDIKYEGEKTRIRMIGIDTPEVESRYTTLEPYGKEASNFTTNLLLGESVYLRFDGDRTGQHDRMRAYLYRAPDELFVNLEIVRQGYGKADKPPAFTHKHQELFLSYERKASEAKKGMHGIKATGE
jgi:micrococcal nuclease